MITILFISEHYFYSTETDNIDQGTIKYNNNITINDQMIVKTILAASPN